MNSDQELDNFDDLGAASANESEIVDDFIKQLEEKEKDLHITADTTFIEIASEFDDENNIPDFMRPSVNVDQPKTVAVKAIEPAADAESKFTAEIQSLKQTIAKMESDREEMFKNSQRRTQDFESYRSRTERERRETYQTHIGNLAVQMLPALDNLNRALDFAGSVSTDERPEVRQFFEGIVLVNRQVNDVFAGMGIKPIESVGCEFDPNFHEAVATEQTDEFPPNTIIAELLRGYCVEDKIIRHSMVKVSTYPPRHREPPQEDEIEEFEIERNSEAAPAADDEAEA